MYIDQDLDPEFDNFTGFYNSTLIKTEGKPKIIKVRLSFQKATLNKSAPHSYPKENATVYVMFSFGYERGAVLFNVPYKRL